MEIAKIIKDIKDKESIIYLVAFIIIAIIVTGVIYYVIKRDTDMDLPPSISIEMIEKIKIERQIKELDQLHAQTDPQSITQEDIDRQIKELDQMRLQVQ